MNLSDSIKRGLLVALVLLTGSSFAGKPVVEEGPRGGLVETKEERGARMGWWREARFGMFIHWGLYAVHGGEWKGRQYRGWSEWVVQGIPVADYETLVPKFNPAQFNAEEWAKLAKDAGMKYIVITTKHHEGFCLWDTKLTTFSVMSTPFKRDIMKELAAACQKEGIRLGWYYSVMDWHHPEYIPRREVDKRPAEKDCYPRYVNYMKGQLKELLTNYGPISVVWFDGDWEHSAGENNSKEIGELIYGLQPGALINNRINMAMDFDTPESASISLSVMLLRSLISRSRRPISGGICRSGRAIRSLAWSPSWSGCRRQTCGAGFLDLTLLAGGFEPCRIRRFAVDM